MTTTAEAKNFKRQLEEFLDYVNRLEIQLAEAKTHLRRHINCFAKDELECLVLDELIEAEEVPPEKQTNIIRFFRKGDC
jgi:predicted transcriptional regulator